MVALLELNQKSLKKIIDELPSSDINENQADAIYLRLYKANPKNPDAWELAGYVLKHYNLRLKNCENLGPAEAIGERAALKTKINYLQKRFNVKYLPEKPSCGQSRK